MCKNLLQVSHTETLSVCEEIMTDKVITTQQCNIVQQLVLTAD